MESRLIKVTLIGILTVFVMWLLSYVFSAVFISKVIPILPEDSKFTEGIILKILEIFNMTAAPSISGMVIALITRYGLREAASSLPGQRVSAQSESNLVQDSGK